MLTRWRQKISAAITDIAHVTAALPNKYNIPSGSRIAVISAASELILKPNAIVSQMTRLNRGRAFFISPDRLGDYVLVDYVSAKRRAA